MDFPSLFDVSNVTLFGFFAGCSYFLIINFLLIGLSRLSNSNPESLRVFPKVTVLVSARNEEDDLPQCIKSLERLDYPKELLQVILVNDRSTDSTASIIKEASERNTHFLALDTKDMEETTLEAKGRGIAFGFRSAIGAWVFITDADAIVQPNWIKACLSNADENTGMLGGTLIVKPTTFLGKIERICWAFVQVFSMGMAGWGIPFACVGPNMAIRKDIYDNAGGLENSGFSVAEDLALLKMVVASGAGIKSYMDKDSSAEISQVPTFGHLISQQRRWLRGGIDTDAQYLLVLFLAFGWGLVIALQVLFGWLLSWKLYLIFASIKIIADITLLAFQKRRLKAEKYIRYFWIMQFYYPIVFTVLPISFIFTRKIHWKGEGYEITYE